MIQIQTKFKINGVDVSLVPDGIKIKSRVYDFSRGFTKFVTKKDVTQKDIRGDEMKIRLFLSDINYNRKRGDTKNNRKKPFRRIETRHALPGRNPCHHTVDSSSEETVYESGEEVEASGLNKADPNNLIERLE